MVVTDPDDQAAIKAESDPVKLRDEWVDLITADMSQIEASRESMPTVDPQSFLGAFLGSLPGKKAKSKSSDHPRGEKRVAQPDSDSDEPPPLVEVSYDSSSSSSDDSEESSDVSFIVPR